MAEKHLTMLRTTTIILAVGLALGACARGKAYGPVPTEEKALAVAQAELGDLSGRPVKVERNDDGWVVAVGPRAADPHRKATTLMIEPKAGSVWSYSEEVVDVALVKPGQ